MTNFGTIYRGVTDDGAFTLWAFGSTSAFDTALGIDDVFFADPNHLPIAVFKFQNLSLVGNPTIDLSNGGTTKLGLIGVDGITSGPPGGVLTFTGLDLLVLATVNGSINLTSDVSFQGLSELAMYARGAGSDLTIDSPISNIGILELAAEGSIQLTNPGTMSVGELDATAGGDLTMQIGGSLLLDGKVRLNTLVLPGTTVATGANLTLNVTGDYTNSSATEFSRLQVTNQGHIGTGGNIAVNIGGNLTATGPGSATAFPEPGDLELLVQNTNAQIDNGGNLTLTVNGNVQVNGLAAYVQNYDETANPAGHIGTGGNIDIEIGGNLSANSYVDVFLNNRGGGMIDSGGNLTFNVSGALTIGVDQFTNGFSAEFIVSSRYDDVGGNTTPSFIGSDVSLFLHAASIDMAGDLFGSGISNRGGSIIDGNATATWDVPGDVTIQGTTNIMPGSSGASWFVLNDIPPDYQFTPPSGGTIHGNATLTLTIGGDLTIAGDALIDIENQRNLLFTGPSGGTIDSDATLNITAANISVGGELDVLMDNFNNGSGSGTGGSIGGNAAINLNLSSNLTTTGSDPNSGGIPGDAYFLIRNGSFVGGSPGGFIGGDATIDLNIGNASIAGLFDVEIDNFSGGDIGGNAAINVNATSVSTADAFFARIDNDTGSTIGGAANVSVNVAGNVAATGDLVADILNGASSIGADANITFHAGGNITSGADTFFDVLGENGTIQLGSRVDVSAQDVSANGSLNVYIDSNNGDIGAAAAVSFLAHDTSSIGDTFFDVLNEGGTIGSSASVDVTANSISAGGILVADVRNEFGHIGTSADLTLTVAGDIHSTGDTFVDILNNDAGSGAGTIGSDATITLNAANITTGGNFNEFIVNSTGGHIAGAASVTLALSGDLTSQGGAFFDIFNDNGGMIGGNATISANVADVSLAGALVEVIINAGGNIVGNAGLNATAGTVTVGTTDLNVGIDNTSGSIGGNASISFDASGDINQTNGNTFFQILSDQSGDVAASIGNDATVTVSGANILTSDQLYVAVENNGSSIGGNAIIDFTATGDITGNNTFFVIPNVGGSIGGDAVINVNAANITADSLLTQIDNTGGSIAGNATINMNVSGNATVTSDATFQILGSDGAAAAAINFNGGSYDAGGTFLAFTDGDGTITFNNASAHADVLKVGALGTNGVLNISGGNLSADTTLKLYAGGSSGTINFKADVTLGGNSAKILAANSVTIFNNVTVTIGGSTAADVYTNNANYTGFGGNESTTGTFAGAGANDPQPLSSAPPFGSTNVKTQTLPSTNVTSSGKGGGKATGPAINISSSDQLLSLLDGAVLGPGGKITIPGSKIAGNWRDSSGINAAGRLNAGRRAADIRDAHSLPGRRLP